MSIDLTFLGTGAAYPSPQRGASSVVFSHEGKCWMFDCGEGTQTQLMRSDKRMGKVSKIFITHLHGDHMFGLPGLLCTISMGFASNNNPSSLVELFGPKGLRRFLRTSLQLSRSRLRFKFIVHELIVLPCQLPTDWNEWCVNDDADGNLHPDELIGSTIESDVDTETWQIYKDDRLTVKAGINSHLIPSFGYVIEENPFPGKLDADKLKLKGIAPGPLYAKLKAGESITSPDGVTIQPHEVLGPSKPGRKIAIMGDTCDCSKMAALCMNVDVLVHEATLCNSMAENAIEKGHSTPEMATDFARKIKTKHLILTHFSQRYKINSKEPENSISVIRDEAEEAFGKTNVIIAEDLMTVTIGIKKGEIANITSTSSYSTNDKQLSSSEVNTWIVGDSIVYWAGKWWKLNSDPHWLIRFVGFRGATIQQFKNKITQLWTKTKAHPQRLIVHIGCNNLGETSSMEICEQIDDLWQFLESLKQDMVIIWSDILPRWSFRSVVSSDLETLDGMRKQINCFGQGTASRRGSGRFMTHPDITLAQRHLFRADGVHMLDEGCEVLVTEWLRHLDGLSTPFQAP